MLEQLLEGFGEIFKNDTWATYFVGQYYFKVNTRKKRNDFGLVQNEIMPNIIQKNIQSENFPALLHEYVHYIHDISTVIGNIILGLDVALKSIFSNYFDPDLKSCKYLGINLQDNRFDLFRKFYITKETINGHAISGLKILSIISVSKENCSIYLPYMDSSKEMTIEIPKLKIQVYENGEYKSLDYCFGRFFIYEGLAYELDRIADMNIKKLDNIRDGNKGTEYTVLRMLAKFIYPEIDKESYLIAASLSLSYLDCGTTFINFIHRIKSAITTGSHKDEILSILKSETSELLSSKKQDFYESVDEISNIFLNRVDLYNAFAIIGREAKTGYSKRTENPAFEISYILNNNIQGLLESIPICDYMYIFTDDEEYNRDFLGTTSYSDEESDSLKVLISYDHYQKSHKLMSTLELEAKEKIKCPFFACCSLEMRRANASVCAEKPWRIFEISAQKGHNQYCWYGRGVGEFKGPSNHLFS